MPRIVVILALAILALLLWYNIRRSQGEARKKLILWTIIWGIIGVLVLLAATGKLNVITAAIGAFIAMLPRLLGYLRYLPLISRFYQQARAGKQSSQQGSSAPPPRGAKMSRQEALDVLGLKPGATREDIIAAHKRMMQKMHPDRGGSDHLARQINQARDVLLG